MRDFPAPPCCTVSTYYIYIKLSDPSETSRKCMPQQRQSTLWQLMISSLCRPHFLHRCVCTSIIFICGQPQRRPAPNVFFPALGLGGSRRISPTFSHSGS